jgi:hypothetical protein
MAIRGVGSVTSALNRRLAPDQVAHVERLNERDAEVRAHEAAHLAAAGSVARGGVQLSYQVGPDGRMYATGGEVKIDVSPAANPQESLAKARQIRAAALAPASPSGQDLAVAAAASRMEAEARQELAQVRPLEPRQTE